ncbi:bifunctional 23S rRNA (guanine(2069)-N(7))-methyltransferase RlmK/23S rRNA (guanine(2445)-N(2))-methyltransferase RlmL [Eggerthellaceae bacterium zg-1084]|uniref:bifunctional 23S rRNA (guanine(2069)-N(7))-methyltransferase RlmK/23S rRNA (guanine(2445)-N(2))-methyltransferase RlmL n=1 Tax=Berryella wangjianweii TaxID=2734634 RepID=UPI001557A28E|nr:bifunctional 23S rRNA (guanine(2069)-N(7))-methyltransferase RlmK/23S rRNA (guanine(2445)-N(2))-methyltransferase RlmL [Berryella wangjianweii]NPD31507.1 bifunctional 23S rRNA (guanine(2069)-N(7))-methyltransferase RlmK/23S rRNA (guanine(2445)-N(2))-methyltransferase RlmL [Berryella wangjianweii]
MTDNRELFASCLSGMEGQLAAELKDMGIRRVRPLAGGVAFFGTPRDALRACLWSRLASRVLLVVGRVSACDAHSLYDEAAALAWEHVVLPSARVAVHATGTNEQLRNTRFTALRVKDAVVDRLREQGAAWESAEERPLRASIDVRVRDERATLSLDLTGRALGMRPYLPHDASSDAATETLLASGALRMANWRGLSAAGAAFIDPVCGNGALLVEAASLACDRAPGLGRAEWGFQGWQGFDPAEWERLTAEAYERFAAGLRRVAGGAAEAGAEAAAPDAGAAPDLQMVRLVGASASSAAVARARDALRRAGLRSVASVELFDVSSIEGLVTRVAAVAARQSGDSAAAMLVACAPEAHAGGKAAAQAVGASTFLAACETAPEGARFALIDCGAAALRFPREGAEHLRVGAGRVASDLRVFRGRPDAGTVVEIPDSAGGAPHRVRVNDEASVQFASRLRKVLKERRKWAAQQGVTCYRLYDADLPEYAAAIDVYESALRPAGVRFLHVSEYAAPRSIDPQKARRRFDDILALAPVVCGVRPEHVFSKTRQRDKGGSQYRDAGTSSYVTTVAEGGHLFEVDLAGRLDTGIFLDHRITRGLVQRHAADARFLNLFGYTGTATVYAAAGGARSSLTVDLSQTYLEWADRNLVANGFDGQEHRFQRADVMAWLTDARRSGRRFDLVFVDPPTFSNSKAMGRRTWDVQRDHVELLIGVSRVLSEDGLAIFSCNLRSFKPDVERLSQYGVLLEDISADTIPADFARTPKIHHCYYVRRGEAR